MNASPHVIVAGGGFAGLAAAMRLVRGGARVTLLERRPFLGGRAYSFTDVATGDVLDNGPHAFMGAYTELLAFLREIGAEDAIAFQPRLCVPMADRRRGVAALAAPAVPGPLQGLAALLGFPLLSRSDRLRLLAGAVRLVALRPRTLAGRTVAEALNAVGQPLEARRCFWDPLAVATLNEDPERAAAAPFAAVLRKGFLSGARAARFGVARGPLGDAYAGPARAAIEHAGGTVRTGAAVAEVTIADGIATGVVLRDGSRVSADAVILAVPASALLRLLPAPLREATPLRSLAQVDTSPIVSVHLWLGRAVPIGRPDAGAPFVGLLGARAQWLFDCGPSRAGGHRIASVTSGARFWDGADDDAIAAAVVADARAMLPDLAGVAVARAHVVRERHATLSLTPAAERARPPTTTSVPNLFLAGDWVQTGLPATIESAVVSGRRAAHAAQDYVVGRGRARGAGGTRERYAAAAAGEERAAI
ncbi:MAG TPA: hydroxysqualene dehydroxylase HpnE [Candidatus Eisenbacteria bacterium]|nr:hydroxysqualene dehydroxylase HpnE [Candidatus Eisenbacteria bacterium]